MTIDEIDFSKLKPYNKSQYQSFELLWYLICKEEYKQGHFTPIDDSGGGDGVEFYLTLDNGDIWGWQCKFFSRLSESGRKKQTKESLKKACKVHGKSLKKWFLCSMSDFTPAENGWFTNELIKLIPKECADLQLFHLGDSELCSYLVKYPAIGNAFFGTNRIDDEWITSRYLKIMNREEIKDKYIANLHSETDAQKEIYCYIGGPLLGGELKSRLDNTTISECLSEFNDSVNKLYEFDCNEAWCQIKNAAINIISEGRTILSEMLSLYDRIIEELNNPSVSLSINDEIDKMTKYVSKLRQLYSELSTFKFSEILAPINWDTEDKENDIQIKKRIQEARETILGPYFVLNNYWSPLSYVFGDFELLKKSEVHIRGNASKGKSHLVLNLLNQYHDLKLPALYISAKDLITEDVVKSQILKSLDLSSTINFQELLSSLNMLGKIHGVKTLLIIDGLNESLYWHQIWKTGISEIRSEIKTGAYDNLILITTYRSSYEEELFGDFLKQSGNYSLLVDVSGFDNDNFYDALKKYTDYYNVSMTNDANVTSLFRENPLALRIFCITNRGRSVSLSNMTIFDIFDKYLQYCNKNIVGILKLPIKYNKSFLVKKLSTVCNYAWENNTNRVPLIESDISTEELSAIESEDLLLYREWIGQEYVMFTYDLLAGYLIAQNILAKYTDKESYLLDFDSTILPKLAIGSNGNQHPLYDDILPCLIILSMDKFGFVYGNYTQKGLVYYITKAIYQSSITTLKQNETDIKNYLRQNLRSSKDLFSQSLPVAFSTENPLNFSFTSTLLKEMTMWKRDLLWTTKTMESLRYEKLDELLTDFITELSDPNTEHWVSKATANYLMWLLTTNCHKLRFLTTKCLSIYAQRQPNEFINLLQESLSIDDLYVPERMLAVAYGFVLKNYSPKISGSCKNLLLRIANVVWEAFFSSKPTIKTPHINIRHYSQKIIEIALKLFPEDFNRDISMIYTAYGITKTDIDKWEKVKGWSAPMQMDFSNYTIGTLIPGGHSYSDPELKQQVRGYIMRRVFDLGWSESHFNQVDKTVNRFSDYSRHNNSDKIDRFGKKYLWIAYYEVAGILQDNGLIDDEYDKWRPAGIDVDPTFPNEFAETDVDFLKILGEEASMDNWINESEDIDFTPKLFVNHCISEDKTDEFVCLYGHISVEDKNLDRSRFAFIRPFIIKTEELSRFVEYLQEDDLSNHYIRDIIDNYSCCAGEMGIFPQATDSNWGDMSFRTSNDDVANCVEDIGIILKSYNDGIAIEFDSEHKLDNLIETFNSDYVEFNVLVPTMNYCVSFDGSIGTCMTLSKEIIIDENLYFIPQTFDLRNSNGEIAFYNVRGHIDEDNLQRYSYLRKNILDKFLEENGLSMVWLIWGEKDYAGRPVLLKKYKQVIEYKTNN